MNKILKYKIRKNIYIWKKRQKNAIEMNSILQDSAQ